MDFPLMKCGCTAQGNALTKNGEKLDKPIPICITHQCTDIVEKPSLEGRKARCGCGQIVDSKYSLAFFEYRNNNQFDVYYCGHYGWD